MSEKDNKNIKDANINTDIEFIQKSLEAESGTGPKLLNTDFKHLELTQTDNWGATSTNLSKIIYGEDEEPTSTEELRGDYYKSITPEILEEIKKMSGDIEVMDRVKHVQGLGARRGRMGVGESNKLIQSTKINHTLTVSPEPLQKDYAEKPITWKRIKTRKGETEEP